MKTCPKCGEEYLFNGIYYKCTCGLIITENFIHTTMEEQKFMTAAQASAKTREALEIKSREEFMALRNEIEKGILSSIEKGLYKFGIIKDEIPVVLQEYFKSLGYKISGNYHTNNSDKFDYFVIEW